MDLAGDFSKQSSIDCVPWLLMASFTQIYSEKEQAEQEKIQNVQFEEKKSIQECEVEAKPCAQRWKV